MPAYDYRCTSCDERFEITRSISDTGEVCCPACGAAAKRVFTPLGVHFKGTGFHNTDYKKKDSGTSDSAKSDSGASASSEGAACSAASSTCGDCPAAQS